MNPKCYSYVRFSTPEQLKGDSLRRQLKMSEDYAKEHGLELDPMSDLGLSAYKGEHRTKGALGRFLELVKASKIPKGSTLIVESLDRLSREQVSDAFDQFRDIIKAGIRIVTLADRMEYTRESINTNFSQLIISLSIMSRANEESATKSRRLKAAWEEKRDKIGVRKLTARAPEWLDLNEERTAFQPIPERAEIVRRIYEMKLSGTGPETIARELNRQAANMPPGTYWMPEGKKGKGNKIPGWRKSYLMKILRNPAVIGEYQPHKFNTNPDDVNYRKRQPTGEVIKNYFPAVVPEELFYGVQAQYQRNEMHGFGSGQTGKVSNLFSHIAKCGYCGSSMEFISKGPKSGNYLACDSARRDLGCKRYYIRYDEFEQLLLTYCRGLNPADVLPGNEEQETALRVLRGRLSTAKGKSKEAAKEVDNLVDSIATTDNPAVRRVLEGRLEKTLSEQEAQEAETKQLTKEIQNLSRTQEKAGARLESLRELLQFLRDTEGDELIEVRQKLREGLRGLIEKIDVYPVGRFPMTEDRARTMTAAVLDVYPDMAGTDELQGAEAELRSRIDNKELRTYHVHFKGGSARILQPNTEHKIVIDLDREGGRLSYLFKRLDGEEQIIEVKA